jgi:hypothetical protein
MSDIHRAIENLQRQINALREQVEAKAEPEVQAIFTAQELEVARSRIREIVEASPVSVVSGWDSTRGCVRVNKIWYGLGDDDMAYNSINLFGLINHILAVNGLPGLWRRAGGDWCVAYSEYGDLANALDSIIERLREKGGA